MNAMMLKPSGITTPYGPFQPKSTSKATRTNHAMTNQTITATPVMTTPPSAIAPKAPTWIRLMIDGDAARSIARISSSVSGRLRTR